MGKSIKKASIEVAAAPISVPPKKTSKKGKRDADKELGKRKSSKKQKREVQEVVTKQKIVKASKKANVESLSKKSIQNSRTGYSSDSEAEKPANRKLIAASVVSKRNLDNNGDSDIDSDGENKVKKKPTAPASKKTPHSTVSLSESDSDEEDMGNSVSIIRTAVAVPKKKLESRVSSSDGDSDKMNKGTDKKLKTLSADVETNESYRKLENEACAPEYQLQPPGLTTVFLGNLSFKATKDDVLKLFEKAGEVIEVRFAAKEDGSFWGFGHVEFASEAAAQNALKLNGQMLLGRHLRIDLSHTKSSYGPSEGKENNSCKKVEHDVSQTVFVTGFDKSLEEDKIRNLLEEHFGSCGEIMRVSIPQDKGTGHSKGFAFVLFNHRDAVSRAFELNGTNLGGCTIKVKEPSTQGDKHGDAFSGGRSIGQGGGHGGGRGHVKRGRRDGSHFKQNVVTESTGNKTKFADND